ncbi:MAG: pyrroline-5-carboxylate reductase [Bacillota bacterium]|nr:pyrroline-5-carboxylate reductase [Bacillota bacterium]
MENSNIGILGCGAMGSALAKGMVKRGGIDPSSLYLFDLNKERQKQLADELKAVSSDGYNALVSECRFIFIAVKPQDTEALLYSIKPSIKADQIIISIAAGITIKYIEGCLSSGAKVIRLMPNTPCLIGEGTIVISIGDDITEEEFNIVENLLKPLGLTIRIPEKLMDSVTGLSGTGPAYVFLFIETMIDAGVSVGIRRDVASKMVIQNVIGSAMMLRENGKHPAELRNIVTSPAGTTAAAMHVLEETGFRSSLLKAVIEATKRSGELRRV